MNMRMATLAATVSCIFAGCATQSGDGNSPQYGARTARPYTQADLDYGQQLKVKMDAARAASDPKLEKAEMEPFRIVGDVYFAGVLSHAVYVIKTPEGVIMIDNGWADTAEKVETSLKKLGIKLTDIKLMLITEVHGDHAGATTYFKEKSGAKLYVMAGDAEAMEKRANSPVKVDKVLHDGEQVTFGGKVLTAYNIAGHTLGSTAWYWQETENGQTYNVADVCCWSTPANVVSNPELPTARLRRNFAVLKSLPVDVPTFGPTTAQFDMLGKLERIKAGEKRLNVFIDTQGYRGLAALSEKAFEDKLSKQLKDGPPPVQAPGNPATAPATTPPAR